MEKINLIPVLLTLIGINAIYLIWLCLRPKLENRKEKLSTYNQTPFHAFDHQQNQEQQGLDANGEQEAFPDKNDPKWWDEPIRPNNMLQGTSRRLRQIEHDQQLLSDVGI